MTSLILPLGHKENFIILTHLLIFIMPPAILGKLEIMLFKFSLVWILLTSSLLYSAHIQGDIEYLAQNIFLKVKCCACLHILRVVLLKTKWGCVVYPSSNFKIFFVTKYFTSFNDIYVLLTWSLGNFFFNVLKICVMSYLYSSTSATINLFALVVIKRCVYGRDCGACSHLRIVLNLTIPQVLLKQVWSFLKGVGWS